MASTFLAGLPRVRRSVLAKEDQHCPICLEEYGRKTPASRATEDAVRLPCDHVVGFQCISTWFKPVEGQRGNNTCPLCRQMFLGIELSDVPRSLRDPIITLGDYLSLSDEVIDMTLYIANRFHNWVSILDYPVIAIAAASLHMASYAMNQPCSIEDISSGIAAPDIDDVPVVLRATYYCLYHSRRELIHEPLLERITGRTVDTLDYILPLPSISFVTAICQGAFTWSSGR